MLTYGGKDLARAYRTVRENTIKIAEEIPESKYDFAPAPDTRTVRQVLTHIALSDSFSAVHKENRTSFDGVNFPELRPYKYRHWLRPETEFYLEPAGAIRSKRASFVPR